MGHIGRKLSRIMDVEDHPPRFEPRFRVVFAISEDHDETIEVDTLDDALYEARNKDRISDRDRHAEVASFIKVFFEKYEWDDDSEDYEPEDTYEYDDVRKEPSVIKAMDGLRSELGEDFEGRDWEPDLIYSYTFKSVESSADELLQEVYSEINKYIIPEYDGFIISVNKIAKYRTIECEKDLGDDNFVDVDIKLRIAEHSYNPKNNPIGGEFIAVTIANDNPTAGRFGGMKELNFDGEDTADEVYEAVNEEVKNILDKY